MGLLSASVSFCKSFNSRDAVSTGIRVGFESFNCWIRVEVSCDRVTHDGDDASHGDDELLGRETTPAADEASAPATVVFVVCDDARVKRSISGRRIK